MKVLILAVGLLAGCSNTAYIGIGKDSFTLVLHCRLAVNEQVGALHVQQTPTTQSAQLDGLNSTPNPETARAIAAGVTEGVIRAGTRP